MPRRLHGRHGKKSGRQGAGYFSFEDFKTEPEEQHHSRKRVDQPGGLAGPHRGFESGKSSNINNQHKTDMDRPEQVRLSEILISTQKEAAGQGPPRAKRCCRNLPTPKWLAQAQAKANQVYATLQKGAKVLTTSPSSTPNGPDLGDGRRPRILQAWHGCRRSWSKKYSLLQPGQYTEPIRTTRVFVILKLTEHQTGGRGLP